MEINNNLPVGGINSGPAPLEGPAKFADSKTIAPPTQSPQKINPNQFFKNAEQLAEHYREVMPEGVPNRILTNVQLLGNLGPSAGIFAHLNIDKGNAEVLAKAAQTMLTLSVEHLIKKTGMQS